MTSSYQQQLDAKIERITAQFAELTPPSLEVFQSPEKHFRMPAEVRIYDRLFTESDPEVGDDFLANLNPDSLKIVHAVIEPALAQAQPEDRFQFEREGYFVADQYDHTAEKPVFNRILDLKDSFKPK